MQPRRAQGRLRALLGGVVTGSSILDCASALPGTVTASKESSRLSNHPIRALCQRFGYGNP